MPFSSSLTFQNFKNQPQITCFRGFLPHSPNHHLTTCGLFLPWSHRLRFLCRPQRPVAGEASLRRCIHCSKCQWHCCRSCRFDGTCGGKTGDHRKKHHKTSLNHESHRKNTLNVIDSTKTKKKNIARMRLDSLDYTL